MLLLTIISPIIQCQELTIKKTEKNKLITDNLVADLKIKKSGESWVDDTIEANVNNNLEFKITVNTNINYILIAVLVELPSIGEKNMLEYISGSSSPKPIFPIGEWFANNTAVGWMWVITGDSWDKEMTFKAKVKEPGNRQISLSVIGVIDTDGNYDEVFDTVSIDSEKSKIKNSFINLIFKYLG